MQGNQRQTQNTEFYGLQQNETQFYTICQIIVTQDIIVNPQINLNEQLNKDSSVSKSQNNKIMKEQQRKQQKTQNKFQSSKIQVEKKSDNNEAKQKLKINQLAQLQDNCNEAYLSVIEQKWSEDFTTENIVISKNQASAILQQNFDMKKKYSVKDQENQMLKKEILLLKAQREKILKQNEELKCIVNAKCQQIQKLKKDALIQRKHKIQPFFRAQKDQIQSKSGNKIVTTPKVNATNITVTGQTQRKNKLLEKYMNPPTPKGDIKNMIDEVNKLSMSLDARDRGHKSIDVSNNEQAREYILKNVSKWEKKEKKEKNNSFDGGNLDKTEPELQIKTSPKMNLSNLIKKVQSKTPTNVKSKLIHNKSQMLKKIKK